MKKLLFLILIPFLGIAQDFTANRINYTITSSTAPFTVKVARNANFTGAAEIPETVAYNSENYAVTAIGESAFEHCNNLTSVTIPNSATTIGKHSFVGCSGLISVTIPNSVTTIGDEAFADCSGLTSVTIPNSVTDIENGAFFSCSGLTSVTIPNSVTTIRENAFTDCSGLTSVTIPNSVTTIGDGSFAECSGLTSVTIPNSVTTIGKGSFAECSGLISITIPNSVTTIRRGIFAGCSGLISVTIPNSVTDIENGAFFSCSGLTSVTIPNSVTAIGEDAFAGCRSLKTVNCHITSPLVINANVFGNITQSNCALNVPTGTQVAYQAAAVWRNFSPISGGLLSNHSFAIESALKIYPNPVSEILNIALQEGLQLEKVNFYNTLGQLIKTTNHSEINVSSFAKGNYFVEVMTNQGKATKTIIVQ
ncbi:leucine-rich repeat domain-containing protein [Flavobacterium psychrophilum]|uniref:leucine-rich repeat domain-containing protein n=12 Tax=Flavobacterium psychrophilum TaxID=96345 RepID=UPI0015E516FC|nr:leucine-rich repeat domain-containing protein [Flavobacterium psychrophilum]QKQ66520.2 leucine-rich repeat domain-containing protein [Flavobacterium psychrophilum]UOP30478.1 leucine-rich repeat protein [Flavobacterium psychrophilum]UOP32902.1 leucine-rich repeat protein [Flavobacterium psychrophilum]UOP35321.1 leucine-rich repeat protein [Flavobacterium psychrophilum]UOP37741.1 leucine-rich repeat protein [Flavobacterium psychrophilum]